MDDELVQANTRVPLTFYLVRMVGFLLLNFPSRRFSSPSRYWGLALPATRLCSNCTLRINLHKYTLNYGNIILYALIIPDIIVYLFSVGFSYMHGVLYPCPLSRPIQHMQARELLLVCHSS